MSFNYIIIILGLLLAICAILQIKKKVVLPKGFVPHKKTKSWVLLILSIILIGLGLGSQYFIKIPNTILSIVVGVIGLGVILLLWNHISGTNKVVSLMTGILLIICSVGNYYDSTITKYNMNKYNVPTNSKLDEDDLEELLNSPTKYNVPTNFKPDEDDLEELLNSPTKSKGKYNVPTNFKPDEDDLEELLNSPTKSKGKYNVPINFKPDEDDLGDLLNSPTKYNVPTNFRPDEDDLGDLLNSPTKSKGKYDLGGEVDPRQSESQKILELRRKLFEEKKNQATRNLKTASDNLKRLQAANITMKKLNNNLKRSS
jgi:hypothetical protein